MKCLFDMTINDLNHIVKTMNLHKWKIIDTYSGADPNWRANYIKNNSIFKNTYHYLIDEASIKDILNENEMYGHDEPNTEIISWMDSLTFMYYVLNNINEKYKKDINITQEYCLIPKYETDITNEKEKEIIKKYNINPSIKTENGTIYTQYRATIY